MDWNWITLLVTLFLFFSGTRLRYIDKQCDGLNDKFKRCYKNTLTKLENEIKKVTPQKDTVLAYASEISAYDQTIKEVQEQSKLNRQSLAADIISIVLLILYAVIDHFFPNQDAHKYIVLPVFVFSAISSGTLFLRTYLKIIKIKSRSMELDC